MRIGEIQCDGIIIDGELILPPKGCTLSVGGVQIHNLKEIVINRVIHTKQPDGSWIQKGKNRDIKIPHSTMIHKAKNAARNQMRFDVWQSGSTLNIAAKNLPSFNSNKTTTGATKMPESWTPTAYTLHHTQ